MQNICQIVVQLKAWDGDVVKPHSLFVVWICMNLSPVKTGAAYAALLFLKTWSFQRIV